MRCVFLALMIFITSGYAQQSTARFLLWQPSARSMAMGGVGTALHENGFSAYYNPAGLGFANSLQLDGSFTRPYSFFENMTHFYSSLVLPGTNLGVFALSFNAIWKDIDAVCSEVGPDVFRIDDDLSWSNPTHFDAKLTYALLLSKNVTMGMNVSFFKMNTTKVFINERDTFFNLLFGCGILAKNLFSNLTYRDGRVNKNVNSGISLGCAVLNAGQKIIFIDAQQADPPPTYMMLGCTYTPVIMENFSWLVAADFEKQLFESSVFDYVHFGTEARLFDIINLRTGYALDTYESQTSYATYGFGLCLFFFDLNVARYNRSLLPAWHFEASVKMEI